MNEAYRLIQNEGKISITELGRTIADILTKEGKYSFDRLAFTEALARMSTEGRITIIDNKYCKLITRR